MIEKGNLLNCAGISQNANGRKIIADVLLFYEYLHEVGLFFFIRCCWSIKYGLKNSPHICLKSMLIEWVVCMLYAYRLFIWSILASPCTDCIATCIRSYDGCLCSSVFLYMSKTICAVCLQNFIQNHSSNQHILFVMNYPALFIDSYQTHVRPRSYTFDKTKTV